MREARRDTDENPPLRAGTDMIIGEPLVVVYHSPPPPGCCWLSFSELETLCVKALSWTATCSPCWWVLVVVVVVVFEPQSYQEPLHMHIFPCNPSPTGLPFVSRLHLGLVSIFMSSRKWERWTDGTDKEEGRGREREDCGEAGGRGRLE